MKEYPGMPTRGTPHSKQPLFRVSTASRWAALEMRCLYPSQRGIAGPVEDHPGRLLVKRKVPKQLARKGADPDHLNTSVGVGCCPLPR